MEQNNKKTYELRIEGIQLVLIGTGEQAGQVLAFRARIFDNASHTPPLRSITVEDIILTGLDEEYAKFLIACIVTHLEPNYPDLPYEVEYALLTDANHFGVESHSARNAEQTRIVAPLNALETADWLVKEGVEINNLPVLDRERMEKVEEGEKTFELTLVGNGRAELRGVTRDTLGMGVDVTYSLGDGELVINSLRESSKDLRSVGQYLLALGLLTAVKAATAASNESVLVKARRGFYQYDIDQGMAIIVCVPQEDPNVYLIRPQFMIMVQSALGDAGFRIRIKGERPMSGSDEDLPGWARNQQSNAGSDNSDSEAVDQ